MQRRLVDICGPFGTAIRSILQRSSGPDTFPWKGCPTLIPEIRKYSKQESHSPWTAWLLKTGIIGCPETSVTTNQRSVTSQKTEISIYTHLRRGGSLRSCSECYYETLQHVSELPETFGESPYNAHVLTPLPSVLQKLSHFQLVPKLPAFYGTRKLITAFQRTSHLSPLLQTNR
jgi:hypothetical protein